MARDEGYLYYNPGSLPFNPATPLRNTIPFIPLDIDEQGVRLNPSIPQQYVNKDIRRYIQEVDAQWTPEKAEEMKFIKETLGLDTIAKNMMLLGSVLEDDAISLSSDDEDLLVDDEFKQVVTDVVDSGEFKPHYPPRTLREIYSLPHKNRGDLKDGLAVSVGEVERVMGAVSNTSELQAAVDALVQEEGTAHLNDVGDVM